MTALAGAPGSAHDAGVRLVSPAALAVALVVLVAACGRDEQPGPTPSREPTPATPMPFAKRACACTELWCLVEQERAFRDAVASQHPSEGAVAVAEATRDAIEACAAPLRRDTIAALITLTDELCACQDRACYDALGSRRAQVTRLPRPQDMGQAWAQEVLPILTRYQECDTRLLALPASP